MTMVNHDRMVGRLKDRRWWLAGGATVVAAVVAVWAVWPAAPPPPPRARPYLAFTACLLTDGQGVASPYAEPVWGGLRQASLATGAKAQYLKVDGPQTVARAAPMLAGLVQGGCDLMFSVGDLPVAAVAELAPRFPGKRFYVIGTADQLAADVLAQPNVTKVDAAGVEGAVASIVTAAAG